MNEERLENRSENKWMHHSSRRGHGRVWAGFFLLLIGVLLLLEKSGTVNFPGWFFSWQGIVIAIGLFTGIRHGFRGGFWLILILVGALGILGEISDWNMRPYIAPIILMAIGLMFILRPRRRRWHRNPDQFSSAAPVSGGYSPSGSYDNTSYDSRDFLDITAVFGGVKKNVLSKTFRGGDIVSFMGGSEIDLTQADFQGKITIDVTNIFGGTKLLVPPTWDVQNDITAIFGGVDDKRQVSGATPHPDKVLILDGTCMFGGIEIRSY